MRVWFAHLRRNVYSAKRLLAEQVVGCQNSRRPAAVPGRDCVATSAVPTGLGFISHLSPLRGWFLCASFHCGKPIGGCDTVSGWDALMAQCLLLRRYSNGTAEHLGQLP